MTYASPSSARIMSRMEGEVTSLLSLIEMVAD